MWFLLNTNQAFASCAALVDRPTTCLWQEVWLPCKTPGLPVPVGYQDVQTQLTVEGHTSHTHSPKATMTQRLSNQPQRHTLRCSFTPAALKQNTINFRGSRFLHHCDQSRRRDPRWQSTSLDHTQYVMTHQSPPVLLPCQQKRGESNKRERDRKGTEMMKRRISEEDEEEEDEETVMLRQKREQQADECSVDGTHQLHWTIMFPAEVSTPAAQILRGRATKQIHGQKHGLWSITQHRRR